MYRFDYFLKYEKKLEKKTFRTCYKFIWKIRKIFILNHLKLRKILFSHMRLDIDYNEDYQKFRKYYK